MAEQQLAETINHLLPAMIGEIRDKLDEAVSIARAAESCASDGNVDRAVQILMDFEPLGHEAQDLFRAALALKRHLLDHQDD